ncbi:DNA-directed RNA polymerase subunit A' [Candidatus Woesearchaeota archaeon]|nr:MAG: DNA-directed RNA polymerase subunit A' [Candidatus Woesearchaeota archaeon]
MEPQHAYKKVKAIKFGVFSPKIIKKMAAAKIVTPELYDREGYPVDGGLMDTRLGVIDPGLTCKTDGLKLKESLGHFGYIELARPVVHINYVNLILSILRSTCHSCNKVLIPNNKREAIIQDLEQVEEEQGLEARRKRIREVIKEMKTVNKCPHCKARQPKVTLEKPYTFLENEKRISPIEVRTFLEKISDEDIELFGLDSEVVRPEWFILTVLPIPPVTMRPSITLETGERSEDDLTHKLGDIVRINQRLFENINAGAPEIIIEDLWDLLQYHVTTYFDNSVAQLPPARHRSGQPLKTISERIKSKEGRIRSNLAGKRTNFSARTVISPDPMIGINEVGVPRSVAMKLTIPERMTQWNAEYLTNFIKNGPKKYPGANYVVRPDGRKKRITDDMVEQILEEIEPGYVVERHLMDGDIAIFNRQPSLHKMSMMCHSVRVLPGRTFRINPAVCAPYNADFDGDEMNLHVPQTEEARAEAEVLMKVQEQLISPAYGLSVIGGVQDCLSGIYTLTSKESIPREVAVDLLFSAGVHDASSLVKKDVVSGREVFSVLLPPGFDFTGKDMGGNKVVIENGVLKSGTMDGANLGQGAGFMLRSIHKKYGAQAAADFIHKVTKLGIATLKEFGFSTGLADSDLPEEAKKGIAETIDEAYAQVQKLIDEYYAGTLETFPGKTMAETLELKTLEILNAARNKTGEFVAKNQNEHAGTIVMARSGAKGKSINLAQMAACVGQQALRGGRISKGYKQRTLSCFKRGDLGPAAHGFIRPGFKDGLSPAEFFFMGMTGRDSLMDTALRTPKSGYLYRRLANAMQDLKIEYDGSVRDAAKRIVQFKYGEDGIDVSKSEGGSINVSKIIEEVMG